MIAKTLAYLSTWDARLFEQVFERRGRGAVDTLFVWLSRSADGAAYAALVGVLLAARAPQAGPFVLTLLGAFALDLPAYHVLKTWLRRRRPGALLPGVQYAVLPPDEYSFPSGHTAGAALVAVVTAAFYPPFAPVAFTWAAGVAVSRVYNGVHFPADVLAGAALGWGCAELALHWIQ